MTPDDIIPIIIFSLVGLFFIIWILRELKRSKDLRTLAERLKMNYIKKPGPQVANSHLFFDLFNRGRGKKVSHWMQRSVQDLQTNYFEYQFVTGHGKNSTTHRQSVVSITGPTIQLPQFVMQPENMMHRIAQKFKEDDIDFDAFPTFSKMFQLKGRDEAAIRAVFTDETLRFLEERKGLCIEAQGDRIIFYGKRHRYPIKQIEGFIKQSLETVDLLNRKI